MHPRRLEKNANITLKSTLLPQAVFTAKGVKGARWFKEHRFTYSFHLGKNSEVQVFGLEGPET